MVSYTMDLCARFVLSAFSDSNDAEDVDDRRSISGYIMELSGNIVAWKSKKQGSVTQSTAEAEYIALGDAAKTVLWYRSLLESIGFKQVDATVMHEDNQSCIAQVKSESLSKNAKHVAVCHHFVCDLHKYGTINVTYCESEKMKADILTKPIASGQFAVLRSMIGLVDLSALEECQSFKEASIRICVTIK